MKIVVATIMEIVKNVAKTIQASFMKNGGPDFFSKYFQYLPKPVGDWATPVPVPCS